MGGFFKCYGLLTLSELSDPNEIIAYLLQSMPIVKENTFFSKLLEILFLFGQITIFQFGFPFQCHFYVILIPTWKLSLLRSRWKVENFIGGPKWAVKMLMSFCRGTIFISNCWVMAISQRTGIKKCKTF